MNSLSKYFSFKKSVEKVSYSFLSITSRSSVYDASNLFMDLEYIQNLKQADLTDVIDEIIREVATERTKIQVFKSQFEMAFSQFTLDVETIRTSLPEYMKSLNGNSQGSNESKAALKYTIENEDMFSFLTDGKSTLESEFLSFEKKAKNFFDTIWFHIEPLTGYSEMEELKITEDLVKLVVLDKLGIIELLGEKSGQNFSLMAEFISNLIGTNADPGTIRNNLYHKNTGLKNDPYKNELNVHDADRIIKKLTSKVSSPSKTKE